MTGRLEDFLGLIDRYAPPTGGALPDRQPLDLGSLAMYAGPAIMAAGGRPGATFGGALGEGLMQGTQLADREQERRQQAARQAHTDKLARLEIGSRLFAASQKEQPDLAFVDVVDPATGKLTKVGVNKRTGERVADVGEVTDPNAPKPPAGYRMGPDGNYVADPGWMQSQMALRAAGANRTSVSVDNRQESEFLKKVGGEQGDQYAAMTKAARNALANSQKLELMGRLAEGITTGRFAETKVEAQKALEGIGIKIDLYGKPDQVAAAETLNMLGKELTLGKLGGEGGMPTQNFSNTDRTFLEETVPRLADSAQGVQAKIDVAKRVNRRAVDVARMAERYVRAPGPDGKPRRSMEGFTAVLDDWTEKNPLFNDLAAKLGPAATAPPPPRPAGLRVTTPDREGTGTRTTTAPMVDRAPAAAPGGDFPRRPDGGIDRTKLVEGQVYTSPQGKRYRFNGTSFNEVP